MGGVGQYYINCSTLLLESHVYHAVLRYPTFEGSYGRFCYLEDRQFLLNYLTAKMGRVISGVERVSVHFSSHASTNTSSLRDEYASEDSREPQTVRTEDHRP